MNGWPWGIGWEVYQEPVGYHFRNWRRLILRFPNPGSSVTNFHAVYVAAFRQLCGQVVDLDDLVRATVSANLTTSSGYAGEAAISRSTHSDRSLDPLYNQLKMYAELFRIVGWLRSTEDSALKYTFTLLGEQVVEAGRYWRPLFGETVLGIAYPSHVIKNSSGQGIRPFATILRTMLLCDLGLSRDEMIVGPLSAVSDQQQSDLDALSDRISTLREDADTLRKALQQVSDRRGVQINTLRNYTRWPIAVLRDLGWTIKERAPYRRSSRTFEIHRLTAAGEETAQSLASSIDLRISDVDDLPDEMKRALSRHAHFAMMERSGFDLSTVQDRLREEKDAYREALRALGVPEDGRLLFSPFQSLSIADGNAIFPPRGKRRVGKGLKEGDGHRIEVERRVDHLFVPSTLVRREIVVEGSDVSQLRRTLQDLRRRHRSPEVAAKAFKDSRREDTQAQFYPLVSNLIQLLGIKCSCSRPGVNYQRWDACAWPQGLAVPIEIKSPSEELLLSTKAVRQAIENKVILHARREMHTDRNATSLIVGYEIPNQRGDMGMLIDDVDAAFRIRIGVLHLEALARLAIRSITDAVSIEQNQFTYLKGFLHV